MTSMTIFDISQALSEFVKYCNAAVYIFPACTVCFKRIDISQPNYSANFRLISHF